MPTVSLVCGSQTDTSSAIRNSLSTAFNNGTHHGMDGMPNDPTDLQSQLTSTAKLALLTDIDYEETKSPKSASQDNVKAKYTTLVPTSTSTTSTVPAAIASSPCNGNGKLGMYGSSTTDKSTNGTGNSIQYSCWSLSFCRWFLLCIYVCTTYICVSRSISLRRLVEPYVTLPT